MTGNPKESKWRATKQADRKRRKVQFALSDECRARLDLLAPSGLRSEYVEALIMAAPLPGEECSEGGSHTWIAESRRPIRCTQCGSLKR